MACSNSTNVTMECSEASATGDEITVTKIVFSIIEIILMVTIVTGNSLTIVAVKKFEKLQTKAHQFLISLCAADLLVGFVMPFHAAFFVSRVLQTNRWACMFRYLSILLSCSASIFNLLVIAIDRYVAIVHSLRYHALITHRLVNVLTAGVWLYAAIIGGLPLVWNNWQPGKTCRFEDIMPEQYLLFVLITQYVIISTVLLILYGRIFLVAADHQRRIQEMIQAGQNTRADSAQNDMKHAKLLALVMGVFLLSWTPFFITLTAIYSIGETTSLATDIRNVCTFLGIFNSSMNPFIYAWKNSDFRSAFVKLLHLGSCCRAAYASSSPPPLPQHAVSINNGGRVVPEIGQLLNPTPVSICAPSVQNGNVQCEDVIVQHNPTYQQDDIPTLY